MSFRRARSPEAPKITMVQGSAGVMELFFVCTSFSTAVLSTGVMFAPSLFCGRLDGMAAKLVPHCGQQLVGIGIGIARRQALQERQRDYRRRDIEIDRLRHRPAAFS